MMIHFVEFIFILYIGVSMDGIPNQVTGNNRVIYSQNNQSEKNIIKY